MFYLQEKYGCTRASSSSHSKHFISLSTATNSFVVLSCILVHRRVPPASLGMPRSLSLSIFAPGCTSICCFGKHWTPLSDNRRTNRRNPWSLTTTHTAFQLNTSLTENDLKGMFVQCDQHRFTIKRFNSDSTWQLSQNPIKVWYQVTGTCLTIYL